MGLGITRFLSPNQGSDLLHGLKSLITIFFRIIRFLCIEFPGRGTLLILASGWRQFLSYEVLCQVVTKGKGSKLRRTTFQSQLDLKLEGVGLEDLQPDMSSDNLQWLLINQETLLMGLT